MPSVKTICWFFTEIRLGKSIKRPVLKVGVTPRTEESSPSSFWIAFLYTRAAYISAKTLTCGRKLSHRGKKRTLFLLTTYAAPSPIFASSKRSNNPPPPESRERNEHFCLKIGNLKASFDVTAASESWCTMIFRWKWGKSQLSAGSCKKARLCFCMKQLPDKEYQKRTKDLFICCLLQRIGAFYLYLVRGKKCSILHCRTILKHSFFSIFSEETHTPFQTFGLHLGDDTADDCCTYLLRWVSPE